MNKRFFSLIIIGLTLISGVTFAAGPFYEGKTIRIIVGFPAGGGFDIYSRAIARHMGKYIPGNPIIIVENMPGAGSLVAANYVYKVAKPNGLTIGNFIGSLTLRQILGGEGVEFDIHKFEWIGVPTGDFMVCVLSKASGITSMEKLMSAKTPVKLGATTAGDMICDAPKILKSVIGLPVRVIEGYKGTGEILLAAESGEVAGAVTTWQSAKTSWRKAMEMGSMVVILQVTDKASPELPNVPLVINFAQAEEALQLIKVGIYDPTKIQRIYTFPPGTPKDLVKIMRKAFHETMKDKEFLAEAEKLNIDVNPVTAEEIEKIITRFIELRPSTLVKIKEILSYKK